MSLFSLKLNPRRGLLYAALALAEATWLGAILLAVLIPSPAQPGAWFASLLLIVGLVVAFGWLASEYRMSLELARWLGLGLAVFGILELLRATLYPQAALFRLTWLTDNLGPIFAQPNVLLIVVGAIAYVWWRCLTLGQTAPGPALVWFTVRTGGFFWLIALLVAHFRLGVSVPGLWLALFFAAIAFALALARTQAIVDRHGEVGLGSLPRRTGQILLLVAVLFALAGLVSLILSEPILALIFAALRWIGGLLLIPLRWLLILILPWLEQFAAWLADIIITYQAEAPPVTTTPAPLEPDIPPEMEAAPGQRAWWAPYLVRGLLLGVVAVVLYGFYRLTHRLRPATLSEEAAEHPLTEQESLAVAGPDVGSWVSAGRERLAGWLQQMRGLVQGQDLAAAATIRRIYAALIALAETQGVTRSPAQTPSEFLEPLIARWPHLHPEFETITTAYINVHYGRLPEARAGLSDVRQAWRRVFEAVENEGEGE